MKRRFYLIAKRGVDVVVAAVALIVLAPFLVLVALAIKLGSHGPVFYLGRRTGLNRRPFRIVKFRTMVVDAERKGGTTTGKDDPRVTAIGRLLRRYKIDELPQLFNVLVGDMSLVGPRPEVEEYTSRFTEEEKRILSVRPGITDWASIRFRDLQEFVGSEDPDRVFRETILPQKNALRLQYVDQQSFRQDLCILWKTVTVLLRPGGQESR